MGLDDQLIKHENLERTNSKNWFKVLNLWYQLNNYISSQKLEVIFRLSSHLLLQKFSLIFLKFSKLFHMTFSHLSTCSPAIWMMPKCFIVAGDASQTRLFRLTSGDLWPIISLWAKASSWMWNSPLFASQPNQFSLQASPFCDYYLSHGHKPLNNATAQPVCC